MSRVGLERGFGEPQRAEKACSPAGLEARDAKASRLPLLTYAS